MLRCVVLAMVVGGMAEAGLDVERAGRHYDALVAAATSNRNLGAGALKGDALFDFYMQTVLTAAGKAEEKDREAEVKGALAALGMFLDDTALKTPLLVKHFQKVETPGREAAAAKVRGTATIAGRSDLALHFSVSATIAAAVGPAIARMAGVQKEMDDMAGLDNGVGTGYSFSDIAANEAGIRFATWLIEDPVAHLKAAEAKFSQKSCFPSLEGLADGLRTDEFDDKYGPVGSDRYRRELTKIEDRLAALPMYKEEEDPK